MLALVPLFDHSASVTGSSGSFSLSLCKAPVSSSRRFFHQVLRCLDEPRYEDESHCVYLRLLGYLLSCRLWHCGITLVSRCGISAKDSQWKLGADCVGVACRRVLMGHCPTVDACCERSSRCVRATLQQYRATRLWVVWAIGSSNGLYMEVGSGTKLACTHSRLACLR